MVNGVRYNTYAMRLPPVVLIRKGMMKKKAPTCEPRNQEATGYASKPPMRPVPMISPATAPAM